MSYGLQDIKLLFLMMFGYHRDNLCFIDRYSTRLTRLRNTEFVSVLRRSTSNVLSYTAICKIVCMYVYHNMIVLRIISLDN